MHTSTIHRSTCTRVIKPKQKIAAKPAKTQALVHKYPPSPTPPSRPPTLYRPGGTLLKVAEASIWNVLPLRRMRV